MILLYILLIVVAAFPLLLTAQRMRRAANIKKNGILSNAVVKEIRTVRSGKGGAMDILVMEYKDRVTGQPYNAKATVTHQKFKIGDNLPIAYLPDKPSKYAIDLKNAYWAILIFSILLFLFVLFAVYKINEMVKSGSM